MHGDFFCAFVNRSRVFLKAISKGVQYFFLAPSKLENSRPSLTAGAGPSTEELPNH